MAFIKRKISRKDFLKNGSITLGLLPLGQLIHDMPAETIPATLSRDNFLNNTSDDTGWQRIRGSWVKKGTVTREDTVLVKAGSGCKIVVKKNENSAVQQAAQFLAKDIEKITGYLPELTDTAVDHAVCIRLLTVGNGSLPSVVQTDSLKDKWEAYQVVSSDNSIWLVGSDFRGTAFAAYTFSERIGIDPLYLWSGYQPEKQETLVVKKINFLAGSPTFRFRGFFHDDEDILPRPFETNEYPLRIGNVPLEWYQKYFETALRLRMNMVAPYTRVRRRFEVQECASNWGLFYTSHHYDILLSNPFGIERFDLAKKRKIDPDWDWYKNRKGMVGYWRGGVEENMDLYTIWPVGLRGTDDRSYTFPEGTPAGEQASVFNEAINTQVQMVRSALPDGHPALFHFTLYTEMLDKYNNNRESFYLPEDVIIVWPDDNNGVMRGLPTDKGKWKHGVYYHLAYYGGANTKQVAHTVSPKTISTEFKKIIDAGATEFMLVNVSELREFAMEGRLLAEMCFDSKNILDKQDPSAHFIKWWAHEYFNPELSPQVEAIYQQYFQLMDKPATIWMGNQMIEDILEEIHKKLTGASYDKLSSKKKKLLKERNDRYKDLLASIDLAAAKMTSSQQQFLFEHVTLALLFDYRPVQAALLLYRALEEENKQKTWVFIGQAFKPLEQLEIEILRAERPPFEKWYRATWIKRQESAYNVHRPYDQLRSFMACSGTISPIVPRIKKGHNIEAARVWSEFLDKEEKLSDKLL